MNPFAEIEITELHTKDGMQSQGKSVRIRDEDADTGWDEIGVVSPNYLLVHNTRVKSVVDQIAERSRIPDWKMQKCFFDGRRFVYSLSTDNITADITPGDVIRFGLIAHNSYDGSLAISVGAYAEHLVCSNGMTSETFFSRFTFKHQKGNINWDEQTEKAFLTIMPTSKSKLAHLAFTLSKLNRKSLSIPDLKVLRQEFLKDFSQSSWGKVMDQYLMHEKHTAFGLLDACTRIFWHNEKPTITDYRNNSYSTDAMLSFSQRIN